MKTVIVASLVHTSILIQTPPTNTEKPGLSPPSESYVINGMSDALPGITYGVDEAVFNAWINGNPASDIVASKQIYVVSEDDAKSLLEGRVAFGFEPGLDNPKLVAPSTTPEPVRGTAPIPAPAVAPSSPAPAK